MDSEGELWGGVSITSDGAGREEVWGYSAERKVGVESAVFGDIRSVVLCVHMRRHIGYIDGYCEGLFRSRESGRKTK